MALDGDEADDDDDCDALACGRRMYAMIHTQNNNVGLWPQTANDDEDDNDDDDDKYDANVGLWPQADEL